MTMSVLFIIVISVCLTSSGIAQLSCTTPNGEQGVCITPNLCEAFLKIWLIRQPKNIKFLRASHCGWESNDPLICCGTVAEFLNLATVTTRTIDITSENKTVNTKNANDNNRTLLKNSKNITNLTENTEIPIINPEKPIENNEATTEWLSTTTPERVTTTSEIFTTPSVTEVYENTPSLFTSKYRTHRNFNMLPPRGECGKQLYSNRIIGGKETNIDEYPWLALLIYKYGKTETYNCGGSIINERYVMTAAHCVAGKNLIKVRLGEYNTAEAPQDCVAEEGCTDPHQEFEIEDRIFFRSFTPRDLNRKNDIALIRLSRNVTYNDFVQPICLPINDETSIPGEMLTVAGWGITDTNVSSEIKMQVQVPVWSQVSCKEIYSIGYNLNITQKQFCAGGQKGKDSCVGDSGGPLMRTFPESIDYYAEGIVSFGPTTCGRQATPGVNVRVSEYIEWILDNMEPF